MDINSVVRLNDGRTSYQVKETMDEFRKEVYECDENTFILLTDVSLGKILINISNIISVTNYDNSL
ncbi:hypothetical protein [Lactobacillus sp. ESL0703]|uniref:hypothetical protein n=1 Tax=Lactobacillus sp. ESL0703 TaxID=2983218 RepID=UPI0023F9DDC1|nr:hypothetical protein [Lactobacillus sp. ESL0703]MDF7668546.1 hypothetical protein [Lactobacillus sp. ESL0703]